MKVGLIVGSLRKESWNRKVAEVTKDLFPEEVEVEIIDIAEVPLYNEDLDGENEHPEYKRIRDEIKYYDGFIFFIPEYNRSYAPAAKNIIDIGSKSPDGNIWGQKPVAVFSASQGQYGAVSANLALRQVFVNTDMLPLQRPEIYLTKIAENFDEEGNISERTEKMLQKAVDAYIKHAKRILE